MYQMVIWRFKDINMVVKTHIEPLMIMVKIHMKPIIKKKDQISTHDENPFENNNGQEDPINANGELKIRRGTRVRRPSQCFLDSINSIDENEPLSLKKALNRPDGAKWKEVVKMEYKSLMNKKTWDLVQIPKNTQPLGCKWIFKIKKKADGLLDKYKARLVGCEDCLFKWRFK